MTIQNTDLLLVNRGGTSYKEDYNSIKQDILDGVNTPNLQAVTDEGATTTNNVEVANLTAAAGVFSARVSGDVTPIPNDAAWDMADSNLWSTSASKIVNPSNTEPGQSGLIYTTAELSEYGTYFQFPGGTIPTVPANSVIPYYVASANTISMGSATEAIS